MVEHVGNPNKLPEEAASTLNDRLSVSLALAVKDWAEVLEVIEYQWQLKAERNKPIWVRLSEWLGVSMKSIR